jgi:glycosyltransferase involved in cell wall biosynthesis
MQLAYLSNFFPSLTETFIYREVMEIRRRGIDVRTYSLRSPDSSWMSGEAAELKAATDYLLPVNVTNLIRCHAAFLFRSPTRYLSCLWKMVTPPHRSMKDRTRSLMHFGEGAVLAERMVRHGITHIHAHYASQSASVARVVHLLTGIPYSFTGHAHDIWHDRLLIPQKLEEALFVATCSRFGREWLMKQAYRDVAAKVHVVYHGLDTRRFIPPKDESVREKNLVVSVGSLGETKGFPDLIRACALLRDQGHDIRCRIVGEGPQRAELEALIKEYCLQDRVELTGAVPQERIMEYYHAAWVFVLPCVVADDGRQDGIPNVLMEAMATGVPVVTTAATAQAELIDHEIHGLVIPPHSPQDLAEAVRRLCDDAALRNRIRIEARRRMEEEFDNRITIEPLLEVLDRFVFHGRTRKETAGCIPLSGIEAGTDGNP